MTTTKHPDIHVQLTGTDGNVFALMGEVTRALKNAGHRADAQELRVRVFDCDSYGAALSLFAEYVEVS